MQRPLPSRPSLEQLKHQAKDLLRGIQSGETEALRRLAAQLPALEAGRATLAGAQCVVAREYGFRSWPKLKQHVEAATTVFPRSPVHEIAPAPRQKHAHLLRMAEHLRRKPHVVELTEQLLALARAGAVEELLHATAIPARLILAIRANVLESGDFPVLRDAIVAGLEHPRPKIRQWAGNLLDTFADSSCVEALRRAVEDPVPRVRRMAFHALTCDECKVAPLHAAADLLAIRLEHALHDPNMRVRRDVTAGLGEVCDDTRVVAALETILERETDEALRANARSALEAQRRKAQHP